MPNWKRVIVSGSDAALNSLELTSELYDNNGSPGTSGQMIRSTGTGFTWEDNIADSAQDLIVSGKNMEATTIAKGTPLYFSGSNTSGNVIGVYIADAGDPDKMPAGGVAAEQLTSGQEGGVYLYGFINGVNTSAFNAGDDVFVAVGGGYTNIKPTGSALIQKLGNVERVDATNGSGVIAGPSWYNDLPNWEEGKIKVGRSDGQPVTSSFVHLDEANGRLGVGTSSPTDTLHVNGTLRSTALWTTAGGVTQWGNATTAYGGLTWDVGYATIYGNTGNDLRFGANGASPKMVLTTAGNVGIGTTAPAAKLDIIGSGATSATTNLLLQNNAGTDLLKVEDGGKIGQNTTLIDSDYNLQSDSFDPTNELQGIALKVNASGLNTYTPAIGFHTTNITKMRSAIAGVQTDSDSDQMGLAFFTHPDAGASVASVEKMRLDHLGNLGIGTTNPTEKLQVDGNIRVEGSAGVGTGNVDVDPLVGAFRINGPGGFRGGIFNDQSLTGNPANSINDITTYVAAGSYHITLGNGAAQYSNKVLTASGSAVGIGTTTPTETLHVSGSTRIEGALYDSTNSPGTSGQILSSTVTGTDWVNLTDISGVDGTGTANYLAKWSDADTITDSVVYDDGTNVGIGTTSPSAKFQVRGSGTTSATTNLLLQNSAGTDLLKVPDNGYVEIPNFLLVGTPIGGSPTSRLSIGITADGVLKQVQSFGDGSRGVITRVKTLTNNTSEYHIGTYAASTITDHLSILSSGNIGIGTTAPENKLHIQQSDVFTGIHTTAGIRIKSDGASAINNYHGTIALSRGTGGVAISAVQEDTDSDVMGMAFFTHPSATGGDAAVEKMRLDQNGNLGIGTSSPLSLLHLDNGTSNAAIRIIGSSGKDFRAGVDGGGTFVASISNTRLRFLTNGSQRGMITADGNWGLGYTSISDIISAKLQVKGSGTTDATTAFKVENASSTALLISEDGGHTRILGPTPRLYVNVASGGSAARFVVNGSALFSTGGTSNTGGLSIDQSGTSGASRVIWYDGPGNPKNLITGNGNNYITSGNVGIGTTTPTERLEVSGNIKFTSNGSQVRNNLGNSILNDTSNLVTIGNGATTTTHIYGNVGIGTTSPAHKLQVEGNGTVLSAVGSSNAGISILSNGTNALSYIYFADSIDADVGGLIYDHSTNGFTVRTGGNNRHSIGTDVGIGTTTPAAKLDVEGDIAIKNANISNQELIVPPGTTVVASVPSAIYSSIAIDYVVKSGLNLRSGTIVACHDGTSTVYTETSTPDLGSTVDITFTVNLAGGNLTLDATTTLPSWEVKTLVRAL